MKVRQLTDISALTAAKALQAAEKLKKNTASNTVDRPVEPSFAELLSPGAKISPLNTSAPAVDAALFRREIGPVQPVIARTQAHHQIEPPLPDAKMSRADEAHVIEELAALPDDIHRLDGAEQMSYLADGYSPKLLRKLKRAQFRVNDELDLHFENQATAGKMLHKLLNEARGNEQLCVLIVHGKGRHSGETGAALKTMVDLELRRRKDVLAFCSAPPGMGGTGAVLVLLKR
jgi:DNA-nicking Smr family endonuclease